MNSRHSPSTAHPEAARTHLSFIRHRQHIATIVFSMLLLFQTVAWLPCAAAEVAPALESAVSLDQPAPDNVLRVVCHIAMSWIIGNNVVEPLVYVDNDNKFIPTLAQSYSFSRTHMDVVLRKGVRFHDGTPFNAQSVLMNWRHYVASAQKTAPYYTLDIRLAVRDMVALSPHTLRIRFKMDGFIGQMLVFLRSFYIYSPAYFQHTQNVYPKGNQANVWAPGPWGTGPYQLKKVIGKKEVALLERNPSYWRTGWPKTDGLILYSPKKFNSTQAHELARKGRIDLFDAVNPSMLPSLTRSPHMVPVIKHPISHLTSLFNTRKPNSPLRDIRVRKALNLLIDRRTLFHYVSHQTAHMTPFVYPLSEKQTLSPYPFDPITAKALLAEAGYSQQRPLSIHIGYYATEEKLAKAIGAMLLEGGITVAYDRYVTRQEYYQHVKNYTHGPKNPIEGEAWDLNIVNSGLYTNTVATHFEAFYSGGGNRWILSDPKADRLFINALRQHTPDGVENGLRTLERYAYNQYYQMPIYIRPTILAVNNRIAGNHFSGSGYLLNLKDIEIGKTR